MRVAFMRLIRRFYRCAFVVAVGVALCQPIRGLADGPSYGQMATLGRYIIANRTAEIVLARSAAPPSISLNATVLVLTTRGYETAERGSNGFTCLVERSWAKAFDDTEFWNPKIRAPVCYNPAASRSILPYTIFRTQIVLSRTTKALMLERLQSAIAEKRLPAFEAGSMAYMMSKEQYLSDSAMPSASWHAHVMLYAPAADAAGAGASWGADRRGSPVVFDDSHRVGPEPWTVFFVPVAHWSDGSASS